jgi:oligopeptide/dipeptide ABC transporter ATP-binding protein
MVGLDSRVVLSVSGLKTYFFTSLGVVHAVDGISFHIREGEAVALVGESGSGKSMTARSIMGLVPSPPGKLLEGEVLFEGRDLTKLDESQLRQVRGDRISMVFQDPMTFLNPVMSVGDQVSEAIRAHKRLGKEMLHDAVIDALTRARVPDPTNIIHSYPHQLSGGMRQRVLIAMAVSCAPALIIADEPTTALDVTVQAQILRLLGKIIRDTGTSLLLITHDLGIVAGICDRVYVMYAGQIIEDANVFDLYTTPLHPYTQGLLRCVTAAEGRVSQYHTIDGDVADLIAPPSGCRFHPRCPQAMAICRERSPQVLLHEGLRAACWLYSGEPGQAEV